MCATAANLIEHVLPRVALRQWVLTFPFRWRRRLASDGELLGHLSRIFVSTVQAFHGGKTGAMTVVQRTSSDLRLNPHLHVVFLDGAHQIGTSDAELVWREHGHLQTREVGRVLEVARRRMQHWLRRRDALQSTDADDDGDHLGTFAVDVLACPRCAGRMTLLAVVTEPKGIVRLLTALGESTDLPERSPSRGPPYWKSTVLRRRALGHAA